MIRFASAVSSLALLLAPAVAQGPTYVLKQPPLVRIAADNVPQLVAQYRKSNMAKLFADEDVRDAVRAIVDYTANDIQRRMEITRAVQKLERSDDLSPAQIASLYRFSELELWALLEHHATETRSVELTMAMNPELGINSAPLTVRTMNCLPQHEGQWSRRFEQEARDRSASRFFKVEPGAKVGGFPAFGFSLPDELKGENNRYLYGSKWMLHLPGRFIYGSCDGDQMGEIAPAPAQQRAEISLEMNLAAFVEGWQATGRGAPPDFVALGFDSLQSLRWSGRFVGGDVYDEVRVEVSDKPTGLVGALLTGSGELPAQPLPKGGMLQLRAAIDIELLMGFLPFFNHGDDAPEQLVDTAKGAFDGGIAIACCAPPPGGLIPRIYLSLGVADNDKLQQLLGMLLAQGMKTKDVKYGDVAITTLKIPGAPQGLQPAWCRIDDTFHCAESARSLRSLLKAMKGDAVALEVGERATPKVDGEAVASFDLRFDVAQLYEAFHKHWLPLYEMSSTTMPAPVTRDDLPDPDVFAEYCSPTRAVLTRSGKTYTLTQKGTLGGFETAALLMTWGPMLCTQMASYVSEQYNLMVATEKLTMAFSALADFKKREQRWPKDVAELFLAEKLADDALLIPADDLAETVELGNDRTIRTSFRYYGGELQFGGNAKADRVLFVEIRPHERNRAILMVDGSVAPVYRTDSIKPIDQFGK